MKVYIAGPITGRDNLNRQAFEDAAAAVAAKGHHPINPHDLHGGITTEPHWCYMRRCLPAVLDSDALLMLDDWIRSRRAVLERSVAIGIGLKVWYRVGDVPEMAP